MKCTAVCWVVLVSITSRTWPAGNDVQSVAYSRVKNTKCFPSAAVRQGPTPGLCPRSNCPTISHLYSSTVCVECSNFNKHHPYFCALVYWMNNVGPYSLGRGPPHRAEEHSCYISVHVWCHKTARLWNKRLSWHVKVECNCLHLSLNIQVVQNSKDCC